MTVVDDNLDPSPGSEDASGHPSDGDDNSGKSGSPVSAVPYHRFQKKVGEARELKHQLDETTSRLARMEGEIQQLRSSGPADSNAPDPDEDEVAYARYAADKAVEEVKSARDELKQIRDEQHRQAALRGLFDEFNSAMGGFPSLGREDYREFAWEQFCIQKDKSRGQADAKEILQGVHSLLSSYAEPDEPTKGERRKLKGKPKDRPPVDHVEKTLDPGVQPRLTRDGKKSLRARIDARMKGLNAGLIEKWRADERRTSGT
jgi:hypothetical protein